MHANISYTRGDYPSSVIDAWASTTKFIRTGPAQPARARGERSLLSMPPIRSKRLAGHVAVRGAAWICGQALKRTASSDWTADSSTRKRPRQARRVKRAESGPLDDHAPRPNRHKPRPSRRLARHGAFAPLARRFCPTHPLPSAAVTGGTAKRNPAGAAFQNGPAKWVGPGRLRLRALKTPVRRLCAQRRRGFGRGRTGRVAPDVRIPHCAPKPAMSRPNSP